MAFQSLQLNGLVLVVSEDLSDYKGISRICQDQNIDVLHFDRQQALIAWFNLNQTIIKFSHLAICIVIEPTFIDVFENQALSDCLRICPKICVSRAGSAETLLQSSKIGLFEFVTKPYRLDTMKETLGRALQHCENLGAVHNRFKNLTKRELETCDLLATGNPNKDIADRLGISIKTVKVHRANLMRKIEVKSIADLLRAYNAFQSLSNHVALPIKNLPLETSQQ